MNQVNSSFERIIGQGFLFFKSLHPDPKTKAEIKAVEKAAATYKAATPAERTKLELEPFPPASACPRVAVWRGYVVLPGANGGREIDLRAQAHGREGQYVISAYAFPQDKDATENWEHIGDGTAPLLGEHNYTDGTLTVAGRSYKLRIIRGDGYMRLRLPQVVNTKAAAAGQM